LWPHTGDIDKMSWTAERIGELEKLWAEGHSTAEIGRRLGVSKNAVVGKAHRMGLPGRQSPIDAARRKPRKAAAPCPRPAKPAAAVRPAAPKPAAKPEVPAQAAAKPAAAAPRPKARKAHSGPSCQWPFGDPRQPDFHFCGAPAAAGKPYCDAHCAVAYNRVSAAQADAKANAAAAA